MNREYCFNLTVPLEDVGDLEELLAKAPAGCKPVRVSRKPDRHDCARYYLSFPFSESRADLKFQQWLADHLKSGWELFGPQPGRWGLS